LIGNRRNAPIFSFVTASSRPPLLSKKRPKWTNYVGAWVRASASSLVGFTAEKICVQFIRRIRPNNIVAFLFTFSNKWVCGVKPAGSLIISLMDKALKGMHELLSDY